MSPKDQKKVISSMRLSHYKRERNRVLPSFAYVALNEKQELMDLLFSYHEQLGVDGYDEDENGIVWSIKDNWYTTEQIKRMLDLKAFT